MGQSSTKSQQGCKGYELLLAAKAMPKAAKRTAPATSDILGNLLNVVQNAENRRIGAINAVVASRDSLYTEGSIAHHAALRAQWARMGHTAPNYASWTKSV